MITNDDAMRKENAMHIKNPFQNLLPNTGSKSLDSDFIVLFPVKIYFVR